MSAPSLLRLFVAVHLSEPVRADLARAAAPLRAALPNIRWARADTLHLTLVFLGERPTGRVEEIVLALEAACKERAAFALVVGANGCFPSTEKARVLWTGLAGDMAALTALWRALIGELQAVIAIEAGGRFSPHLTMGRLRDGISSTERADAGRRWMSLQAPPPASIPVEEIHLMRSTLGPGGPRHATLRSVALARGK